MKFFKHIWSTKIPWQSQKTPHQTHNNQKLARRNIWRSLAKLVTHGRFNFRDRPDCLEPCPIEVWKSEARVSPVTHPPQVWWGIMSYTPWELVAQQHCCKWCPLPFCIVQPEKSLGPCSPQTALDSKRPDPSSTSFSPGWRNLVPLVSHCPKIYHLWSLPWREHICPKNPCEPP